MASRARITPRPKTEGEKPFWISFSDLMTALMVLFLVIMSVSLLSVAQALLKQQQQYRQELTEIRDRDAEQRRLREARSQDIDNLLEQLVASSSNFQGVQVNRDKLTIDFGEVVRFASGDYRFTREGERIIRGFIREVLRVARTNLGQRWIRRVVVDGFTDIDGSYLFNLDLSLKRAQNVVCSLLREVADTEVKLSLDEQQQVRVLFLVGGFSYNSAKALKDESRRVELRLEFRAIGEDAILPPMENHNDAAIGRCLLH